MQPSQLFGLHRLPYRRLGRLEEMNHMLRPHHPLCLVSVVCTALNCGGSHLQCKGLSSVVINHRLQFQTSDPAGQRKPSCWVVFGRGATCSELAIWGCVLDVRQFSRRNNPVVERLRQHWSARESADLSAGFIAAVCRSGPRMRDRFSAAPAQQVST